MATIAESLPQRSAAEEAAYKRRWVALLILSLSLTVIVIDATIVNIAFPAIRKTFGASFADAEWVNSIYSLIFGAALITWGKLGDQYGRRNIFILGTTVFVLGSLGTGLAGSIGVMIFFRALQGLGAAMMSPSTLSIISSTFVGKERAMAFGLWGATAGVAAALGPILGGWLITYGTGLVAESWRLAFLINVPVGIIAILGSIWAIREYRESKHKHHIDWIGIVLGTLALGSIVFGSIEGQAYGWFEAKKVFSLGPIRYPNLADGVVIPAGTLSFIPFMFILGAVLFALFIYVEVRQERQNGEPLFEFGMLKYRSFAFGLVTVFIVALGEFGVLLALSIYFQLSKNLDAFQTGIRFLPFAVAVLITAPMAGVLSSRFGAKWVVTAGMICEAVAVFWTSRVMYEDTRYLTFLPPFVLYGVGIGLAIAQLANLVLSDIPPEKAGVASGANNTLRQLGASIGIAMIGAVLFGAFATETKPLIANSTAFSDFGTRVEANSALSKESKAIGAMVKNSEALAKQGIQRGLDNNEGFDAETDTLDSILKQIPAPLLLLNGVDLGNTEVLATVKRELKPDADILGNDIQTALGTGFAAAGRQAGLFASVFVALGALSSLMLPNTKAHMNAEAYAIME